MDNAIQTIGNTDILAIPDKVAFLSSRKISAADVLKCYEWAEKIRETTQCVISGFHSPLEKDLLKFLLRGKAPIILVLARKMWKAVPDEMHAAVELGRLLIVSPIQSARASVATAAERNRWILSNASSLVIGAIDSNGNLAEQVADFPSEQITYLCNYNENDRQYAI